MRDFFEIAGPIASVICVALGAWQAQLLRKNRRLKNRLRRALNDCGAFYEIETRLCSELEPHLSISAVTIKRNIRKQLRADSIPSPSEDATPQRIDQELQRLE